MGIAPGRPTTQTELLRQVPLSNRSGAFPRKFLAAGERLYFETRPGLLARYWGRLTIYLLLLLLWVAAAVNLPDNPVAWFLVAVFSLLLVYTILAWRGIAYALTDRRVLAVSGVGSRQFQEAEYEAVQNLSITAGASGDLRFDTQAGPGAGLLNRSGAVARIRWVNVPYTPQVYRFVQDAFNIRTASDREERTRQAILGRAMENTVTCAYCGARVDIRRVDSHLPKCPQCGAPLFSDAE